MDNKKPASILFDPRDLAGMRKLMEEHGGSTTMFPGTNENGEDVYISIFRDRIVVRTIQANNWTRLNYYYPDGSTEEMFER